MVHIALKKRRVEITKNHLFCWINFSANNNLPQPNLNRKRRKSVHVLCKRLKVPLVEEMSLAFQIWFFLYICNLNSRSLIITVSIESIQLSLNSGSNSVLPAANDLVQETTIGSQEFSLSAWNLLLSHRQAFLENHLAYILISPNQYWTFERRVDVLASSVSQDMDASGMNYQTEWTLKSTGKIFNWN